MFTKIISKKEEDESLQEMYEQRTQDENRIFKGSTEAEFPNTAFLLFQKT